MMEEKTIPGGETEVSEQCSVAESSQTPEAEASERPEERRARYRALITGEFKDLYTADTQRIIDRRFKETRGLQEALEARQGLLDRLCEKLGAEDADGLEEALTAEIERAKAEAAKLAEQRLADHIRSAGARPAENGGGGRGTVTAVTDVKGLTKAQRAEFARRCAKGETITFR